MIEKNFKSLEAAVDDFILHFEKGGVDMHKRDTVIEFCSKAKTFQQAVERACASRRENGKMFHHQSKVKEKDRQKFGKAIIKDPSIRKFKTFDEFHDKIEEIGKAIVGIGPVTIYDVAVRIAAYQKLEVTSLYLHAGVRIGWHRLYDKRSPNAPRIPRNELPKALLKLKTDSIEDFLCGYRASLKPWLKGTR